MMFESENNLSSKSHENFPKSNGILHNIWNQGIKHLESFPQPIALTHKIKICCDNRVK